MAINSVLSPAEAADYAAQADKFNRALNEGKPPKGNTLGQEDFLQLLTKQLQYQDPLSPMDDKAFIAQMAQFSSLQSMNTMAADISKLTTLLSGRETTSEAYGSLGKSVELVDGEKNVQGKVMAVTRGAIPEILVNGATYPWESVVRVFVE
jgi:flagellar basal-body rod modification protein FlgD